MVVPKLPEYLLYGEKKRLAYRGGATCMLIGGLKYVKENVEFIEKEKM